MAGAIEVSSNYASKLNELGCQYSKPVIVILTKMAKDYIHNAPAIVEIIENHLRRGKPELKLQVLYLIGSIVKNVKKEYVNLFSPIIASMFALTYEKGNDEIKSKMWNLRESWNDVFPSKTLSSIDNKCRQTDPWWHITAPPLSTASANTHPHFLRASKCSSATPAVANSTVPSHSFAAPTFAASAMYDHEIPPIPSFSMDSPEEMSEVEMRELSLLKQNHFLQLKNNQLERELVHTKAQLSMLRSDQITDTESEIEIVESSPSTKHEEDDLLVQNFETPQQMHDHHELRIEKWKKKTRYQLFYKCVEKSKKYEDLKNKYKKKEKELKASDMKAYILRIKIDGLEETIRDLKEDLRIRKKKNRPPQDLNESMGLLSIDNGELSDESSSEQLESEEDENHRDADSSRGHSDDDQDASDGWLTRRNQNSNKRQIQESVGGTQSAIKGAKRAKKRLPSSKELLSNYLGVPIVGADPYRGCPKGCVGTSHIPRCCVTTTTQKWRTDNLFQTCGQSLDQPTIWNKYKMDMEKTGYLTLCGRTKFFEMIQEPRQYQNRKLTAKKFKRASFFRLNYLGFTEDAQRDLGVKFDDKAPFQKNKREIVGKEKQRWERTWSDVQAGASRK